MKHCLKYIYQKNILYLHLYISDIPNFRVMGKAKDNAIAPSAGYIFQFEIALLMFTDLETNESISVEQVDDVAKLDDKGTILVTTQVKHSISTSGSTYQDTSLSLWRTLEIWITKLENGTFNNLTKFVCTSNKEISEKSLICIFKKESFEEVIVKIKNLLYKQKGKLKTVKRGGSHVKKIITLIEFALSHQNSLKTILTNLEVSTNFSPKEYFFNKIHFNSRNKTQTQKDNCYEAFYGWIIQNCMAKWKNGAEAIFSKTDFDTKYYQIISNPSIVNAIFRAKKYPSDINNNIVEKYKDALFVKQIKDLVWRKEAKERAIYEAIIDFIFSEIELKNIIDIGDYTAKDFEIFTQACENKWTEWYDAIVIKETNEYTEEEKDKLAIDIYLKIMKEIHIQFGDSYLFTDSTKYVQNGTFLKLSDNLQIGWHPEWKCKYSDYKNKHER